jgi:cell division protein FtsI/penicillin-binding protein 2
LVKPHVVRQIRSVSGTQTVDAAPVRRVLEPQVSATLTKMLVDSAKVGEAQLAVVPGFNVAAKTGTAQVASPKGGYEDGKFIASLLGFAPADDPKFVMLVKVDEPQGVPFGSEVAAPVWREIAKQLFVHFKIEPTDPVALAKSFKPTPTPAPAAPSARPAVPAARASSPSPAATRSAR